MNMEINWGDHDQSLIDFFRRHGLRFHYTEDFRLMVEDTCKVGDTVFTNWQDASDWTTEQARIFLGY
jgi:hypothetical protein